MLPGQRCSCAFHDSYSDPFFGKTLDRILICHQRDFILSGKEYWWHSYLDILMRRNNEVPSQRGSWTAWYCMYEFIQTCIPEVANPLFSSIWIMMGRPLNSVSAGQGIQKCIFDWEWSFGSDLTSSYGGCSFVTIYFPFSPPPMRDQTFVIFFCICIQKCPNLLIILLYTEFILHLCPKRPTHIIGMLVSVARFWIFLPNFSYKRNDSNHTTYSPNLMFNLKYKCSPTFPLCDRKSPIPLLFVLFD